MHTDRPILRRLGLAAVAAFCLGGALAGCTKGNVTGPSATKEVPAKDAAAKTVDGPSLNGVSGSVEMYERLAGYRGPYKMVVTTSGTAYGVDGPQPMRSTGTEVYDGRSRYSVTHADDRGDPLFDYAEVYDGKDCYSAAPSTTPTSEAGAWRKHTLGKGESWSFAPAGAAGADDDSQVMVRSVQADADGITMVEEADGISFSTTISLDRHGAPTRSVVRTDQDVTTTTFEWGPQQVELPAGAAVGGGTGYYCAVWRDGGADVDDPLASAESVARSAQGLSTGRKVTPADLTAAVGLFEEFNGIEADPELGEDRPTMTVDGDHVSVAGKDGSAACVRIEGPEVVYSSGRC